jgi:hypothetical protein
MDNIEKMTIDTQENTSISEKVVDENRSWYRVSCFANNNKTDHVMLSTKQYEYPITNQSKS